MIHRLLFLFLTMLLSRLRSRALGKLHELGVLLLTLLGSQGFYGPLRCHQVDVRCINFEVVLNFFSSYSFVRGLGLIFHLRILHAFQFVLVFLDLPLYVIEIAVANLSFRCCQAVFFGPTRVSGVAMRGIQAPLDSLGLKVAIDNVGPGRKHAVALVSCVVRKRHHFGTVPVHYLTLSSQTRHHCLGSCILSHRSSRVSLAERLFAFFLAEVFQTLYFAVKTLVLAEEVLQVTVALHCSLGFLAQGQLRLEQVPALDLAFLAFVDELHKM